MKLDKLTLSIDVHVNQKGYLELPNTVLIERKKVLDICGGLSLNTQYLTTRDEGALRTSFPGYSGKNLNPTDSRLNLNTLSVDYLGKLEPSQICSSTKVTTLQLTYFKSIEGYVLDQQHFALSSLAITHYLSPELNATCTGNVMHIYRNKECTLTPGIHAFDSITIETGGVLKLLGDAAGSNKTKITAKTVNIEFSGLIEGTGTGYQTNGPGAGSVGATHGGSGEGNTLDPYGSIISPTHYGSNGVGATATTKRGGGQIHLEVTETFVMNGDIIMNGQGTGSGGSILIVGVSISGTGTFRADGGAEGGGGGRIAVKVNSTYEFTGELSVAGGSAAASGGNGITNLHSHVEFMYSPHSLWMNLKTGNFLGGKVNLSLCFTVSFKNVQLTTNNNMHFTRCS